MNVSLKIGTIERDESLVIVVEGELDILTSPALDEALALARAKATARIIVDLHAVSFIDSTGLHVLIRHASAGDAPPRILLTKGSPQAQRVFDLSGASEFLPFVSD